MYYLYNNYSYTVILLDKERMRIDKCTKNWLHVYTVMLMFSNYTTLTTPSITTTLLSSNCIDTIKLKQQYFNYPLTLFLLTSTTSTYVLSSTSGLTEPPTSAGKFNVVK